MTEDRMTDRELVEQGRQAERYVLEQGDFAHPQAKYFVHGALEQMADRLEALSAERDQAIKEARSLAESLWRTGYQHDAPHWQPFEDLVGLITQIDNMTTGIAEKARRKAERQRDEALAVLCDFREHVLRGVAQWHAEYGTHHHPIWKRVASVLPEKCALPGKCDDHSQALATTTQASAPAKKLDPELERLLAWSRRNPPTDAELREQRVSWARGELRMSHPDMSYEEADERARRAATTHEPVVSEDQVEAAPFYCPHCGEGIDIEEVSKAWDDGDRIWPAQVSIVKATQEGE